MKWIVEANGVVIAETCSPLLADAIFEACASVESVVTMWAEPL